MAQSGPYPTETQKVKPGTDRFKVLVARYRPRKYTGNIDMFLGEDVRGEASFWKRLVIVACEFTA